MVSSVRPVPCSMQPMPALTAGQRVLAENVRGDPRPGGSRVDGGFEHVTDHTQDR